jgi:hypothetical protein
MHSVAYLGNSVTAQKLSYVEPLHEEIKRGWGVVGEPRKAGVGGVGSLALAGLLDWLVLRHEPSICFIESSLADAGGATPKDLIGVGLSSILSDLLEASAIPIVLHLPRLDIDEQSQDSVVDIYRKLAARYQVLEVDVRHLGGTDGLRDGIHTYPAFSTEIASEIFAHLGQSPPEQSSRNSSLSQHRVRMLPAAEGDSLRGDSVVSSFRMLAPTVVLPAGSTFAFSKPEARFLGLYVVANNKSGVIRLWNDNFRHDIQVWDQWCVRPRIQFVTIPPEFSVRESLFVELTDRDTADSDCQGNLSAVVHRGSSLEILGAAVLLTHSESA